MGLATLRKESGLSLHQLAKKSGVNYQKIYQIEKGTIKVEHIMLRTAKRLADALNCTPEDLLIPDKEETALAEEETSNEGAAEDETVGEKSAKDT